MEGFFRFFNYTKSGHGIQKDAKPRRGFIYFFEIFFRKFWHLVKMNLLFALFNLPAMVLAFFIFKLYLTNIIKKCGIQLDILLLICFATGAIFLCIPMITVGPFQAGLTYVLKNFAREEHVFLWHDFKKHTLKNFKQSSIICLIDILITVVLGLALHHYLQTGSSNGFFHVLAGINLIILLFFMMMHLYIYQLLITFELSVKNIYRNAFLLSVIKFIPNLCILLICSMLVILPLILYPFIGAFLYFFITLSLCGLIINFFTYRVFEKYLIKS